MQLLEPELFDQVPCLRELLLRRPQQLVRIFGGHLRGLLHGLVLGVGLARVQQQHVVQHLDGRASNATSIPIPTLVGEGGCNAIARLTQNVRFTLTPCKIHAM